MQIPNNRWMFIGISWSENQGLYLYNNGRLIAQTKIKTPQNQVPIGKTSPNFVFGRSLAGSGFASFYLASFSTFTTFLAQSAMKPVYTYYWRLGKFIFRRQNIRGIRRNFAANMATFKPGLHVSKITYHCRDIEPGTTEPVAKPARKVNHSMQILNHYHYSFL